MRFSHITAMTLIAALHLVVPLILILWTWRRSYASIAGIVPSSARPLVLHNLHLPYGVMGVRELLLALRDPHPGRGGRHTVPHARRQSAILCHASFPGVGRILRRSGYHSRATVSGCRSNSFSFLRRDARESRISVQEWHVRRLCER